jgi:hypothetical protein
MATAAAAPHTNGVATSERNSLFKTTVNPLKTPPLSMATWAAKIHSRTCATRLKCVEKNSRRLQCQLPKCLFKRARLHIHAAHCDAIARQTLRKRGARGQGDIAWMELRRPGEIESVRGGQSLAKIVAN